MSDVIPEDISIIKIFETYAVPFLAAIPYLNLKKEIVSDEELLIKLSINDEENTTYSFHVKKVN